MADASLIFVLDAALPYIRHPETPGCVEETRLFNAISHTYLPLLRACTALETEAVPFKLAIAFAPTLCEMLADPLLQTRYIETLDRAIDFGLAELDRNADSPEIREMLKVHLDQLQLNRRDFVEIYDRNILKKFDYFANRGYLEILATTATSCFLPLYTDIPEAINAQIETGLLIYRKHFTAIPSGFWLPAMAWAQGLESILKSYGFQYTILESHSLLFSDSVPDTGVFSPVSCENGFTVFARDTLACADVASREAGYHAHPEYLDVDRDIGFEFDEKRLSALFDVSLGRRVTGFRYWARGDGAADSRTLYEPSKAHNRSSADAARFLDRRGEILAKASAAVEGKPVTAVCAFPASLFGQDWYEGVAWLESVYRLAGTRNDFSFSLPANRFPLKVQGGKTVNPCYSSWTESGYAEEVLNNANDWMYPYIRKAVKRMIDLAERFPDDTGLKERSLNMAARELLLAQSMEWFLMMNDSSSMEYARKRFEASVRAFTVVYESLGSNFISTEWLTCTEKAHNLFHEINYRVFRKKK